MPFFKSKLYIHKKRQHCYTFSTGCNTVIKYHRISNHICMPHEPWCYTQFPTFSWSNKYQTKLQTPNKRARSLFTGCSKVPPKLLIVVSRIYTEQPPSRKRTKRDNATGFTLTSILQYSWYSCVQLKNNKLQGLQYGHVTFAPLTNKISKKKREYSVLYSVSWLA